MAFELINTQRGSSIIRVEGTAGANVAVANLAYNANEVVSAANIKRLNWSTNGNIQITRNSVLLLSLHGTGELRCDDLGYSIANNNSSNIIVTINTGGTLIMEVSKDATYTTALVG